MLKVGGENVAPAEVEALLSTHPAVAMAQVVGRPDDEVRRGAGRVRRADAGTRRHRDELIDALPRPAGQLQAAARGAVRDRMADVGDQDPEVPAARDARGNLTNQAEADCPSAPRACNVSAALSSSP